MWEEEFMHALIGRNNKLLKTFQPAAVLSPDLTPSSPWQLDDPRSLFQKEPRQFNKHPSFIGTLVQFQSSEWELHRGLWPL